MHNVRARLGTAVVVATLTVLSCTAGSDELGGSGTVEATPVTVSARTSGELLEMGAGEGTRVQAGDVLARIDPTTLQLELEQALQSVEMYVARLDLLRAGARDEDVRQAQATLDQADENLELARRSYERVTALFEGGSATSSDLDAAQTQYEVARAGARAARAALDKVDALVRPEEIRAAEAQLAGARAAAERVRHAISETTVRSPISGTVLTRVHEPGELVVPGTALYRVANLSTLTLTIFVPGPRLAHIRINEPVRVRIDSGDEFAGRVAQIASEAEFTPRNVQTSEARSQLVYAVDIALDNKSGIFKIGMPADATFAAGDGQ